MFSDACENLGAPYASYNQLYSLAKNDQGIKAAFINFMYTDDLSKLLREYRKLVINELKR